MDRGAWWAAVHGVTELGITEQLMLLLLIQKLRSPYVCGFSHLYEFTSGPSLSPAQAHDFYASLHPASITPLKVAFL